MQSFLDPDVLLYGISPIIVGIIAGFPLGGFNKLQSIERTLIAVFIGISIGLILSFVVSPFISPTNISYILAILASTGGTLLGMTLNWSPSLPKGLKHHIIYEPDEEGAFDREIDDVLKGKYNQRET